MNSTTPTETEAAMGLASLSQNKATTVGMVRKEIRELLNFVDGGLKSRQEKTLYEHWVGVMMTKRMLQQQKNEQSKLLHKIKELKVTLNRLTAETERKRKKIMSVQTTIKQKKQKLNTAVTTAHGMFGNNTTFSPQAKQIFLQKLTQFPTSCE